jgi:YegS/Rv2252/BmrU family lipid kinase
MSASGERERALIVVNSRARLARTAWRERAMAEIATRYAVDIVAPDSAAATTRSARVAADAGFNLVVAAGGDGTVNAVARGLCGSNTALGILPLGSANDLARELRIPRRDVGAAARLVAIGHSRRIDLGAIGERVFCGVGGIALVARATMAVTRFKQRSKLARRCGDLLGGGIYRISATAALLGRRPLDEDMHVAYRDADTGEQRELDSRASALFVTNHRTLGGGLVLPVDGDASDGVLEIGIVPARSRPSLVLNFARLSAGARIPAGVLQVVRAREMSIETDREDAFVADGELLATGRRFDVRVLPGALLVISATRGL